MAQNNRDPLPSGSAGWGTGSRCPQGGPPDAVRGTVSQACPLAAGGQLALLGVSGVQVHSPDLPPVFVSRFPRFIRIAACWVGSPLLQLTRFYPIPSAMTLFQMESHYEVLGVRTSAYEVLIFCDREHNSIHNSIILLSTPNLLSDTGNFILYKNWRCKVKNACKVHLHSPTPSPYLPPAWEEVLIT